jgi:hypothetical protein
MSPAPANPDPSPPADRRAWPRFACPADTRGEVFDPETFAFQTARLLNLSAGGVALLTDDPAPRQTALWVEVERHGRSRTLPAEVRHVRRTADGWLHGCALAVALTADEVRDLMGQ